MRPSGRRTLYELTTFDFIRGLVISEAVQQGLVGDDYSIANATIVVVTLVFIDVGLSFAKTRFRWVQKVIEGTPTILVEYGRPWRAHMKKARVSEEDIMESARELQGLERMDQIKFAGLEVGGRITVILAKGRGLSPEHAATGLGELAHHPVELELVGEPRLGPAFVEALLDHLQVHFPPVFVEEGQLAARLRQSALKPLALRR